MRSNKNFSTIINTRTEANATQILNFTGTKVEKPMGTHASHGENDDSEDKDYLYKNKGLGHPVKPILRCEPDINQTVLINENPNETGYHKGKMDRCRIYLTEVHRFWGYPREVFHDKDKSPKILQ